MEFTSLSKPFLTQYTIVCWKAPAITMSCPFTHFPKLALASALKIRLRQRIFPCHAHCRKDGRDWCPSDSLVWERMQPAAYKFRSGSILILRQKRIVLRQLKKQLVATRNLKGQWKPCISLPQNARKPWKKQLFSLKSKSRWWRKNRLLWHKAGTRNRWTYSLPSKVSV